MAKMPASIEAEARAAVGWLDRRIHHETTAETAAAAPIPAAHAIPATRENAMQPSAIFDDLKNGAVNADNWLHDLLGTHLPALVATVERYQANPIVQELEALGLDMLPPGDVALITQVIRMAGKLAGAGAAQVDVTQLPPGQTAPIAPADTSSDPRNR